MNPEDALCFFRVLEKIAIGNYLLILKTKQNEKANQTCLAGRQEIKPQ